MQRREENRHKVTWESHRASWRSKKNQNYEFPLSQGEREITKPLIDLGQSRRHFKMMK